MMSLPFSDACERNKEPILEVLKTCLPRAGNILEIGSCTGQHVTYFAPHFPQLLWQPTDRSEYLEGLAARITVEGAENILPPIELDVFGPWPGRQFEAAYSANTSHIMSWDAVCAMFAGLGVHLVDGAIFCLYGPFNQGGQFTSVSNQAFDQQLRARSPDMGLRDLEALESLAMNHHMHLVRQLFLPANNQILVFKMKGNSDHE